MTSNEFWNIAWPAFWMGAIAGILFMGIEVKRMLRKLRGSHNG